MGSTPMLAPASQAGSRESAGLRLRIEVPRRRRRSAAMAREGRAAGKRAPQRALRLERRGCGAPEVRGDDLEPCPDAGEGRALTYRADGAATLVARGTGVGYTSTYSDVFNVR